MATNAWHRDQAERWAGGAKANLDELAEKALGGRFDELHLLASAAHSQSALAQVHATLSLAPYPGVGRVIEILDEWDRLSKGPTVTTERIRAALEDNS